MRGIYRRKLTEIIKKGFFEEKKSDNIGKKLPKEVLREFSGLSKIILDKFATRIINNTYVDIIIKSTFKLSYNSRSKYSFRSWKYITIKVRYFPNLSIEELKVSPNSDYGVTLRDYIYLLKNLSELEIKKITLSILVQEVSNKIINIDEYIVVTIYVNNIVDDIARTACLIIKVHIIDNLKANILISTDTITSQRIYIDFDTKICKFDRY